MAKYNDPYNLEERLKIGKTKKSQKKSRFGDDPYNLEERLYGGHKDKSYTVASGVKIRAKSLEETKAELFGKLYKPGASFDNSIIKSIDSLIAQENQAKKYYGMHPEEFGKDELKTVKELNEGTLNTLTDLKKGPVAARYGNASVLDGLEEGSDPFSLYQRLLRLSGYDDVTGALEQNTMPPSMMRKGVEAPASILPDGYSEEDFRTDIMNMLDNPDRTTEQYRQSAARISEIAGMDATQMKSGDLMGLTWDPEYNASLEALRQPVNTQADMAARLQAYSPEDLKADLLTIEDYYNGNTLVSQTDFQRAVERFKAYSGKNLGEFTEEQIKDGSFTEQGEQQRAGEMEQLNAVTQSVTDGGMTFEEYLRYLEKYAANDMAQNADAVKQAEWENTIERKYGALDSMPDFKQNSQYDEEFAADPMYALIVGTASPEEAMGLTASGAEDPSGRANEYWTYGIAHMTDAERRRYAYLYYVNGKAAADEYLSDLMWDLGRRRAEEVEQVNAGFADARPVLASAASVISNAARGFAQPLAAARELIAGDVGEYDPMFAFGRAADSARQTVGEKIDEAMGGANIAGIPIGSALYNALMSAADSAMMYPIGAQAGAALMGLEASNAAMQQALEAGRDGKSALLDAAVYGGIEGLTERLPLEKLFGSVGSPIKYLGQNVATEAAEEAISEIAGTAYDTARYGEDSTFGKLYAQLIAQGYSEGEAMTEAWTQFAKNVAESAAVGGLAGGMGAAPRAAITAATDRKAAKNIQNNDAVDQVLEVARTMEQTPEIRALLDKAKNTPLSKAELGRVFRETAAHLDDSAGTVMSDTLARDVETTLEAKGMKGDAEVIHQTARAVAKAVYKPEMLTAVERENIARSGEAVAALNELTGKIRSFDQLAAKGNKQIRPAAVDMPQTEQDVANIKVEGAKKKNYAGLSVGEVDVSGINMRTLTKHQRYSVAAIGRVAKAVGFNVRFVESVANKEGKYTTENGSWNSDSMTMTLDIHAGSNTASDVNYAMMQTAGHELTHYIREFADGEMWQEYQDFVTAHLTGKMGIQSFGDEIQARMANAERQGKTLEYDTALEEVVADASVEALMNISESDLLEIANSNPNFIKRVGGFIKNWVSNVRKMIERAFAGTQTRPEVAIQMRDALDELSAKWNRMLVQASKNANRARTELESKRTAEAAAERNAQTDAMEKTVEETEQEADEEAEEETAPRFLVHAHIDNRTPESVRSVDTELFSGESDEARVGFAAAARMLLADVENSVSGQKFFSDDSVTGQKRMTSRFLAQMKDSTGWTWDKIRNILQQFVDSENGKLPKNTATNREMELYLDEVLSNGYTTIDGVKVSPWDEYIAGKAAYEGAQKQKAPESAYSGAVDFVEYAYADVGSEEKFSLRTMDDGTKYTMVDADDIRVANVQDSEAIGRRARLYMRERFRGTVLPVGKTKTAYVRSDSINEYTNPAKFIEDQAYERKMIAATELDNLLKASTYLRWNADDGRHKDAVRGWTTWRTIFAVHDKAGDIGVYSGEVKIKRIARGDVFYDITQIKNITNDTMGKRIIAESQSVGDTLSIAQGNEEVKFSLREGIEFAEDKYYSRMIDHFEEQKPHGYIKVGKVGGGSILREIGLPEADLYFDNAKINRALNDHADHVSKEVLKQIPSILRNPVVVAEEMATGDVNVFGDLMIGNSPVLVGIVVTHDRSGKNVINKVRTIHARRDAAKKISDESVLYLSENKKRTRDWFQAQGTQLPLRGTKFGFIRSIARGEENVKFSLRDEQTDTRNFKRWFADSKIVNADELDFVRRYKNHIGDLTEKYSVRDNYSADGMNWAVKEGLLTKADQRVLHKTLADKDYMKYNVAKTKDGKYVIPCETAIVFASGTYKTPVVEDVVIFNVNPRYYDRAIENAMEVLYGDERSYLGRISKYEAHEALEALLQDGSATVFPGPVRSSGESDGHEGRGKGRAGRAAAQRSGERAGEESVDYQLRDPNQISDRELLANAMESAAANADELDFVRRYKNHIADLNEKQMALEDTNRRIVALRKADEKGNRDAILKLQANADTLSKQVDRYDKKLLSFEAAKPLKAVVQRERERVRKRTAERMRESAGKEKYRERIEKDVNTMRTWLTTPTNKGHVPEFLRASLGEFLESLDFSSARSLNGGDATQADARMLAAMERMREALRRVRQDQSGLDSSASEFKGYIDLPGNLEDNFDKLVRSIRATIEGTSGLTDTAINRMTSEQLKTLSESIRAINTAVRNMNRLLVNAKYESAIKAAQATIKELDSLGEKKDRIKAVDSVSRFMNWKNTVPFYAFKRFGAGGKEIFEGMMDGWDKLARNAKELIDYADKSYTTKEVRKWSREVHSIELASGETVRMTTAQMMSLYCLSKREQAVGHLMGGGIRVGTISLMGKEIRQSANYTLSMSDLANISGMLTQRQREVADRLQEFMNTRSAEWGNEVSMKRFGYEMFTEENYFPIETDANNRKAVDEQAQENSLFRLLNLSATKPLAPNARNAIVIRDVFDVFTAHCSDMAKYNALGLPILDALKWYNYVEITGNVTDDKKKKQSAQKSQESTGENEGNLKTKSVQKSLESAYGDEAKRYIVNLLRDLNGVNESGRNDGFINKLISNAKVASVGATARVYLLQATSLPRAAYAISPKYLSMGLASAAASPKRSVEEAERMVGIAQWKALGFYDTNISRSIREMVKHDTNVIGKIREWSMSPAGMMDKLTLGIIYRSVQAEMRSQHSGVAVGSTEYNRMVNNRVREIVYQTQVVDSTMTRSDMMRGKGIATLATAFMSEPTLSMNMLNDSLYEAQMNRRRKEPIGAPMAKFTKAMGVYAFTAVLVAMLESVFDAERDDDEYETFGEKFMSAFITDATDQDSTWKKIAKFMTANLGSNLNPLNNIPVVSDVMSIVEGYDSAPLYTAFVASFKNTWDVYQKYLSGEGGYTLYNVIYNALKGVSQMIGVPIGNTSREVVSLWNTFIADRYGKPRIQTYTDSKAKAAQAYYTAIANGDMQRAAFILERARLYGIGEGDVRKAMTGLIKDDYISGDFTEAKARDWLAEYAGKDDGDIDGYIRDWTYARETGRQYNDMKADYIAGAMTKEEAQTLLVQYRGYDSEKVYWTLREWDYAADHGGDSDGWTKYADFLEAAEAGKGYEAYARELLNHGADKSDIARAIAGQFKEEYRAVHGTAAGDRMLEKLLDVYEAIGYDRAYERRYITNNWLE